MVVGVQGVSLTFQQPEDFIEQMQCSTGSSCEWLENASGGNSKFDGSVMNIEPLTMTYSAITQFNCGGTLSVLYNAPPPAAWICYMSAAPCGVSGKAVRYETIISGGIPTLYRDGVVVDHCSSIATNPQYITWSGDADDTIWGSTESRYMFGMPDQGYWTGKQYFLMKDVLNPAASGFYRKNTTDPTGSPTLIASYTFTSTFSKNDGVNKTVEFYSPDGGMGGTYNTGSAYSGSIYWNLTQFFGSTAGYGLYQTTIQNQTGSPGFEVSEWIPYIGSGANIQFDRNSYSVGETATLTVTISDSYYDVVTSPHVVIMDIFGTEVVDDTTITFTQAMSGDWVGTSTYTWADDEDEGVYFGMIYATYNGDDVLMNYDTADLNSNIIVSGYVFNAETAAIISGATVNVTQGITTDSLTTATDGNYSSVSAFSANAPTTIVASKSGYETYQHVFTPLYAGTIQINLTLMPTSPTYTGIALGGIARTPPYNRTINSATVYILNTTDGHSYTATTNAAGYYIQNDMAGASHWFDIWGTKTGFSNSSIYQKLVAGI